MTIMLKLICTKKNGRCLNSNVTCSDFILALTVRFENHQSSLLNWQEWECVAQHPVSTPESLHQETKHQHNFFCKSLWVTLANPLPLLPTTPILPKPPLWALSVFRLNEPNSLLESWKSTGRKEKSAVGRREQVGVKTSSALLRGRSVQEISSVGVRPDSPFTIY